MKLFHTPGVSSLAQHKALALTGHTDCSDSHSTGPNLSPSQPWSLLAVVGQEQTGSKCWHRGDNHRQLREGFYKSSKRRQHSPICNMGVRSAPS